MRKQAIETKLGTLKDTFEYFQTKFAEHKSILTALNYSRAHGRYEMFRELYEANELSIED
jgi:hypothetical protein